MLCEHGTVGREGAEPPLQNTATSLRLFKRRNSSFTRHDSLVSRRGASQAKLAGEFRGFFSHFSTENRDTFK